jgi:hypothetical protein
VFSLVHGRHAARSVPDPAPDIEPAPGEEAYA